MYLKMWMGTNEKTGDPEPQFQYAEHISEFKATMGKHPEERYFRLVPMRPKEALLEMQPKEV